MTPFLRVVANDIYERFNGHLEDIAVVFPNKRASLFFSEYLLECNKGKAMWSPRYMTIGELFQQNSSLAIGDQILLVSKLYKEYVRPRRADESVEEYEKSIETLDSFYYWGEMLLRDFDDVDKHLADARQLFSNIKELRELGIAKETLTKEQAASIAQFFNNFNQEKESEIKKNFLGIWERLYTIYTKFRESLRKENLAYEGMLYRDVIENSDSIQLPHEKYVFVGFNALNDVETKLFDIIDRKGKALFYWDYDKHYTGNLHHEAGHFMRKNLERFPNAIEASYFNNLSADKSVTVIETSSESIEARYLSKWLDENLTPNEIETAVVLCDETMLEPVLHTIPSHANGKELESMNVTMGFPISHTPIFTLVKLIVDLHSRGWSEKHGTYTLSATSELLNHPYVVRCTEGESIDIREQLLSEKRFFPTIEELSKNEFLGMLFRRIADNREWFENISAVIKRIANSYSAENREEMELYEKLFCEAIYKAYTQTQRIVKLVESGELVMKQQTLGRLFVRMLSFQSLPFHGEPVVGLQIMGLLETRNLDFKNIILLGVNEGNLPKNSGENSYIPYNLRRAFGLTLSEHRDSIYAYYFYRLLQRAENITLVYNSAPEGKSRGECSRYILQLLGSNLYDIRHLALSSRQGNDCIENSEIKKSNETIESLISKYAIGSDEKTREISPSAINCYIRCGLSFFYKYVLGIRKSDEVSEEVENSDFGNIFHAAADDLYKELSSKANGMITKDALGYYAKNEALLYRFIDKAFSEEFFNNNKPEYNGEQYINRGVLHHFLLRLVKIDMQYAPFLYIGGERKINMPFTIDAGDRKITVVLGGTIDRVDIKGDIINIVDYKTGRSSRESKTSLDNIFAHETSSAGYRLQAFLYSIMLDELLKGNKCIGDGDFEWIEKVRKECARKIAPSLLYIHDPENSLRESFIVDVLKNPVTDITDIKEEYMHKLAEILQEIFDESKPFTPAKNERTCEYCDYRKICGK